MSFVCLLVYSARGRLHIHKLENISKALDYLKSKKVCTYDTMLNFHWK